MYHNSKELHKAFQKNFFFLHQAQRTRSTSLKARARHQKFCLAPAFKVVVRVFCAWWRSSFKSLAHFFVFMVFLRSYFAHVVSHQPISTLNVKVIQVMFKLYLWMYPTLSENAQIRWIFFVFKQNIINGKIRIHSQNWFVSADTTFRHRLL